MNNEIQFNYFHSFESEQFAFYRIPKLLFTDDHFRNLSSDAKVLYGLMLDRMSLSVKNQWIDEEDRVYIIFTLEQVMQYMNCGKDKGVKIMAELDSERGIGLIERVKQGLGRPTIIYVKNFLLSEHVQMEEIIQDFDEESEAEPTEVKTSEKPKSGVRKNRSQDFGKTEVKSSENQKSRLRKNRSQEFGKSEVKTSEKTESGLLENRSQDFWKTDSINTDNNDTEMSDTYPIIHSHLLNEAVGGTMDAIKVYTEVIKSNVDYPALLSDAKIGEEMYIDAIIELIVETICIPRDTVMIAGAEYPHDFVKDRFLKLTMEHIRYVLLCLNRNKTQIHNMKSYLLTCLFNAPATIHSFYQSMVNYDMTRKQGGEA